MKSTKSTVYNSFTYGRLQFGVPLFPEALVPLLPAWALDPFSFFQNSLLSQMKTYSRTFFSEIWLLHRSYSTKNIAQPRFFFACWKKMCFTIKVYSQNKNAVKTQNKGIVECFCLSFASALSFVLFFLTAFSVVFTPCYCLCSIYPFFPLPWLTHYLKSWEYPWWTTSVIE